MSLSPLPLGGLAIWSLMGILSAPEAAAIERSFAGSAQLDYHLVPGEDGRDPPRVFEGFTSEVALKVAVDVSERLSANVKVCHGCHGFELPMAYFDYRLADELNIRVGRFSPSFGSFNLRHDPANHSTSSKPLPYDMGRMLRMDLWNQGVLPSPFPDNGIEVGGSHWFNERTQLDYAVYAVSGFKAAQGSTDLEWSRSLSSNFYVVDNNDRPAVGSRLALTLRIGEANDITAGASGMYGTYDPQNQHAYTILGADLAARLGRTQIRMEYLVRRQSYSADPAMAFQLPVPDDGREVFSKHGYYLEIERGLGQVVAVLARVDGLYRDGNVLVASELTPESAIFRYTVGATVAVHLGWRVKASAELWAFSDAFPNHQRLEPSFHLAIVGTF